MRFPRNKNFIIFWIALVFAAILISALSTSNLGNVKVLGWMNVSDRINVTTLCNAGLCYSLADLNTTTTGGSSGNPFNQFLNTSSNVTFSGLNITNGLKLNSSVPSPVSIASQGTIFYNSSLGALMSYNGSDWIGLTGVPQGTISAFNLGVGVCPSGWSQTTAANNTLEQPVAKVWVRFNGGNGNCNATGDSCPIFDSFNVQSVKRLGNGRYSVNLINHFANGENYVVTMGLGRDFGDDSMTYTTGNASQINIGTRNAATAANNSRISVTAFGDGATDKIFCEKIGQDSLEQSNGFWGNSGSNLFVQNTSWNVGIGTNNPTMPLTIKGNNSGIDFYDASGFFRGAVKIPDMSFAPMKFYSSGSSAVPAFEIGNNKIANFTVGIKLALNSGSLETQWACNSVQNGSIMRNDSGIYVCGNAGSSWTKI